MQRGMLMNVMRALIETAQAVRPYVIYHDCNVTASDSRDPPRWQEMQGLQVRNPCPGWTMCTGATS